jgi:SAM-dependent methyltransferase
MLKDAAKAYLEKQQYFPNWFGMFVNPYYFSRKGLYANIADLAGNIDGKILDVGCGQKPYAALFKSSEYIGLEIDTPENRRTKKADCFYDGSRFPFSDQEFDSVVVNEVFEHVFNPVEFLMEIKRVLKPGGMLLMTVPFCWDEHEQPHDYARYSSFGLMATVEKQGFTVIEHRKSMNDIRAIFQLLNGYIYKKTFASVTNSYLGLLANLVLIAPFTVLGELLAKILPRNDDLYLDNIILAKMRRAA